MGNDIAKLFGVEREEKGLISILLIQSVFLGIFYGVFNITAFSLFLAKFDEVLMARAFVISGLVGILLTWLYTRFQSRMRFHNFASANLLFVLIVTVSLWLLVISNSSDWVIFAILILMGPLNLLALLGFYGTTGRLFTLRQGRRLFGIVDTGIVVGVILSSFSIPVLLSMNVSTSNILLISALSILAALFVQSVIGRRYKQIRVKTEAKKESEASMKLFKENPYIRSLGMFIAFSMVVAFFIQYSFMAVTRARYPLEEDLASFLGLFEGSMMVFTLLIKTFIFSYLIKNHGLKITLAIGPILIGIFAVVAAVVGSIMGYQPESAGFLIFFLVLALGRLFSKAMKDSLETPAFKVLYQTITEKLRYGVQSLLDGTVNEMAALISGLLLTALSALSFVKLIHFSWVLSILIAFWVYSALKLYSEYRKSVRQSIDIDEVDDDSSTSDKYKTTIIGTSLEVKNNYYSYITGGESIKTLVNNPILLDSLIKHVETNNSIDAVPLFNSILSENPDIEVADRMKGLIDRLNGLFKKPKLANISSELDKAENKKEFIQSVFASEKNIVITDLIKLLRNKDIVVKREALFIVGAQEVVELLPDVCECLSLPSITKDAYATLRSFGKSAFDVLKSHYFRSVGNTYVRKLIIRLFAESGEAAAQDFLFDRLWSVHRELRADALKGLAALDFKANEQQKDKILQEILEVIGLQTWNISAMVTLRENKDELLLDSLNDEFYWWSSFLFGLLSLVYDSNSFEKIRTNLESGTVESVNLALEMIDIIVDDAIKPRLTSLLDVVSEEDRLKSLFQFYPGEIPAYDELVIDLVNTDYNKIGVWTKASAIKSLYNLNTVRDPDFLIALLFSPYQILREESLRFLNERFDNVFEYCSYRVPESYLSHLKKIVNGELPANNEIYNKLSFLYKLFPELHRNDLIDLSLSLTLVSDEFTVSEQTPDFICWDTDESASLVNVKWHAIGKEIMKDTSNLGGGSPLFVLNVDAIADTLFDNPELSSQILNYLETNIIKNAG